MKKEKILLILIIFLAVFLRFWQITKVPAGFYSDEAAFGYNAYAILKTGRDEYGKFLPLAFQSFGDFKAPLYFYLMVPYVFIFGLNPWAVRATSASLGVASVILTYLLAKRLFKNQRLALLASFFLAISPFALQFNRMAHEGNLADFLIILGTLLFLKGLEKPRLLLGATISFVLSLYAYHNTRVFTPLFALSLLFLYWPKLKPNFKWLIISCFLGLVLLLPLAREMFNPASWSRIAGTNILQDPGLVMQINEERGEDYLSGAWPNKILHNKAVMAGLAFLKNYLSHFNGDFLFASGDPVKIYKTPGNGLLYWWQLPLLLLGIFLLLKKPTREGLLLLAWFLLAPLASALTRFVPSASRSLIFVPTMEIFLSFGAINLLSWWQKREKRRRYLLGFLGLFLIILNGYYYWHSYFIHLPLHYAREWQDKCQDLVMAVKSQEASFKQVWVSKKTCGYIHFLFFLKVAPAQYQPEAKPGPEDEYGFTTPIGFAKYHFGGLPSIYERNKSILYVAAADELPQDAQLLKTIYYLDGKVAFYFFSMP